MKRSAHDQCGRSEDAIDVAVHVVATEVDVSGNGVVYQHGIRPAGFLDRGDHGQRVVGDLKQLDGVFREVAVGSGYDGNRIADEPDPLASEGRPSRAVVFIASKLGLDRAERKIRGRQHGDNPRQTPRARRVDRVDGRVGVRGAHEGEMQQARRRQVVHVASPAPQEMRILLAPDRLADHGMSLRHRPRQAVHASLNISSAPGSDVHDGLTLAAVERDPGSVHVTGAL